MVTSPDCERFYCGKFVKRKKWVFNDPFKAQYPNAKSDRLNTTYRKNIQQFYRDFNEYDKHSRETRYQFTLSNKMIWVSSDSRVFKLRKKATNIPRHEEHWRCTKMKPYRNAAEEPHNRISAYGDNCGSGLLNFRSSSATPSQQHNRPAKCHETAWGVTDPSDNTDNTHWMTWNTGDLQPPGLQTIHAIPSPQPPSGYGQKGFISPKLTREPTPKQPTPPLVRPASKSMSITNSAYSPRNIKAANKKYETAPHPHFRSWHTKGCDNYEADVTYNMLQHLYGGKARELDRMRRTRPGRYEHPINFERRIINGTYKSLERGKDRFKKLYRLSNSSAGGGGSAMQRAPMDYYPVSRHQSRSGVGRTDHTASSFFQYTQPSVKSSFVIHPQFVSEHCEFSKQLKSTKNLSHLTAARGDNAFRYGSSRSAV